MNQYVKEADKLVNSDNLVEANLKYVLKVAHRYKNYGTPLEDLVQEGNIGLLTAAEKFDKKRGVKFLTYATPYILKFIKGALGANKSIVSTPGSHLHKSAVIKKAQDKLLKVNKENDISEISTLTGFSQDVVKSTLKHNVNYTISLDKPVSDDDERTVESIFNNEISYETPDSIMNTRDRMEMLNNKLSKLDSRSRDAVNLRYLEGLTLNEVGIQIGCTAAGASGIINKALKQMRG